jgi:hypothetical protein
LGPPLADRLQDNRRQGLSRNLLVEPPADHQAVSGRMAQQGLALRFQPLRCVLLAQEGLDLKIESERVVD